MASQLTSSPEASTSHLRDLVSAEEWSTRVDLAAAYRLVAMYGWDDLIFTHLSARVPGPDHHFLINPYTHMFDEMTASTLVKIDADGNNIMDTPARVNRAGFVIHSALHNGRDDAMAVLHLHTPHGQAVSAMAGGLLPHTQTAMIAHHDIAYHDFEGIATELEERDRLVADLGSKNSMILRNHGTLTIGKSIPEAFLRMYFLERACQAQVMMLAGGGLALNDPNEGIARKVESQTTGDRLGSLADEAVWPALLRKLDRLNPGFRV